MADHSTPAIFATRDGGRMLYLGTPKPPRECQLGADAYSWPRYRRLSATPSGSIFQCAHGEYWVVRSRHDPSSTWPNRWNRVRWYHRRARRIIRQLEANGWSD